MELLIIEHHTYIMSNYQIKIAEPCHENWDEMSPNAKGKFCGSCAKDVIDFTYMTDQEVKLYFINYKGSICGRFNKTQLKKKDERYFKLPAYTKQFVKAFAMVFIMFTSCNTDAQTEGDTKGKIAIVASDATLCSGEIFNSHGDAVINAKIKVLQHGKLLSQITTDEQGKYSIKLMPGDYDIEISKPSYEKYRSGVTVSDSGTFGDFELKKTDAMIDPPQTLGMVEMGEPEMIEEKK